MSYFLVKLIDSNFNDQNTVSDIFWLQYFNTDAIKKKKRTFFYVDVSVEHIQASNFINID